jgi:hypothetical protein
MVNYTKEIVKDAPQNKKSSSSKGSDMEEIPEEKKGKSFLCMSSVHVATSYFCGLSMVYIMLFGS